MTWGPPWWSRVRALPSHCREPRVRVSPPLVGELISHKPQSTAKKKNGVDYTEVQWIDCERDNPIHRDTADAVLCVALGPNKEGDIAWYTPSGGPSLLPTWCRVGSADFHGKFFSC